MQPDHLSNFEIIVGYSACAGCIILGGLEVLRGRVASGLVALCIGVVCVGLITGLLVGP